jgi:alkanesulfonate monooxygenase SsuD/methylene tetrahydromethanopterin reductase-like flavin-dependent oxidoreductase (luciferase family)
MKVWLYNNVPYPWRRSEIPFPFPGKLYDRQEGKELYDSVLALHKRADELGFDGLCFTEHHSTKVGMVPSPNLMAAAVATHTEHAKIVLTGNCLPIHGHPVRLAEELAMVDVLSNGRLISGFIRGGAREYYAYGVDIARGRGMFEEAWNLIVRAWTEDEPFAWHGEHYHYDVVSILPRPLQRPHPPLVQAGNTAESIEWAAHHHAPLLLGFMAPGQMLDAFDYYRRYAQDECGWAPQPADMVITRPVYVAPTDAQASAEAEQHVWDQYLELSNLNAGPIKALNEARQTARSFAYRTERGRPLPATTEATYDDLIRERYFVGSPDTVLRRIEETQKRAGFGVFMAGMPFGGFEPAQAMKNLELFGKEVLPALH